MYGSRQTLEFPTNATHVGPAHRAKPKPTLPRALLPPAPPPLLTFGLLEAAQLPARHHSAASREQKGTGAVVRYSRDAAVVLDLSATSEGRQRGSAASSSA